MAIAVDVPPDVERHLRQEWPDLERRALEALVVDAYGQRKIGCA